MTADLRDQLAAVLDGEYGSDAALIDALLRVLVAAQQEAAAAELEKAAGQMADPRAALWLTTRATALRAGPTSEGTDEA